MSSSLSGQFGGITRHFVCQTSYTTQGERIEVNSLCFLALRLTLISAPLTAQTTILVLEHWIPLVANAAVISKVIGFYPPQLYTLKRRLLYISPPIFLLFSRAVLICYLTYIANLMYTEATSIFGQVQQVFNLDVADQFVIIGTTIFATEAAFCLYTSCFLIYKICQFYFNLKQQDGRGIRRKSRFFLVGILFSQRRERKEKKRTTLTLNGAFSGDHLHDIHSPAGLVNHLCLFALRVR
jgi:hypothetical protein